MYDIIGTCTFLQIFCGMSCEDWKNIETVKNKALVQSCQKVPRGLERRIHESRESASNDDEKT